MIDFLHYLYYNIINTKSAFSNHNTHLRGRSLTPPKKLKVDKMKKDLIIHRLELLKESPKIIDVECEYI